MSELLVPVSYGELLDKIAILQIKSERMREHVFLSMLAYYVEWHMRQKLAELLFDEDPMLVAVATVLGVVPFIYYSTVFYGRHIEPRLIKTRDEISAVVRAVAPRPVNVINRSR